MRHMLTLAGLTAALALGSGPALAGTCTTEIEALQKMLAENDAGMGPTTPGTVTETGQLHPPTDTMNEAAEGKATSSEDVLSQNLNAPTDSEAAEAGQYGSSAGAAEATASLQRARDLDQKGDEAACMTEITKAKAALSTE